MNTNELLLGFKKLIDYHADINKVFMDECDKSPQNKEYTLKQIYQSNYNQLVILREWITDESRLEEMLKWNGPEAIERITF